MLSKELLNDMILKLHLGLIEETGYKSVELWNVDLSRFSSVKEFADKFEKDGGRLDILVQNAAILSRSYGETSDGWEES